MVQWCYSENFFAKSFGNAFGKRIPVTEEVNANALMNLGLPHVLGQLSKFDIDSNYVSAVRQKAETLKRQAGVGISSMVDDLFTKHYNDLVSAKVIKK